MEERSITVKRYVTVPVQTWEAAAFQENLQDVKITFGLQSRIKEQKDPDGNTVTPAGAWTEVPGEELSLDGFNAVNVTRSGSRTMPKYDIYGNELEYRFDGAGDHPEWNQTGDRISGRL